MSLNLTDKRIREEGVRKLLLKSGSELYHYTSVYTLFQILQKKEIWFGHTETMNDKRELRWFLEEMQQEVEKKISDSAKPRAKEFFDNLFKRLLDEYPFALCLSQAPDDVGMWERYADNEKGVCIVFDAGELLRTFYCMGIFLANPVFYGYDVSKHKFREILNNYFENNNLGPFLCEKSMEDNLIPLSALYKNISYEGEREWRLATLWNLAEKMCNECDYANIDFEVVNGEIKRMLKLNIEEICKEQETDHTKLIKKIILGPRCPQNDQVLKRFCEKNGFHDLGNHIESSKCALR